MNRMFFAPTVSSLRRYLHAMGIRLKPWFTQAQILDSLYLQLADERRGDVFWNQLRDRVQAMLVDLRQRPLPDNGAELAALDPTVALDDIRTALAKAQFAPNGFRDLGQSLSPTSLYLLVAVSVCAVGCGGEVAPNGATAAGATGDVSAGGDSASLAGGRGASGGNSPSPGSTPPLALGGSSATGGSTSNTGAAGAPSVCSSPPPDIAAILTACGIDSDTANNYLAALAGCDPDWSVGIAEYFNCRSCGQFTQYLYNCFAFCTSDTTYSGDPYASCAPLYPVPIYLVVLTDGAFGRCKAPERSDPSAPSTAPASAAGARRTKERSG